MEAGKALSVQKTHLQTQRRNLAPGKTSRFFGRSFCFTFFQKDDTVMT